MAVDEPGEVDTVLAIGPCAFPSAIKVVPEQYGIIRVGQPDADPETRIAFSIVAVVELEQGSAQVTLVSGYASQIEAETRASWIRSAITDSGNLPEAIDRLITPVVGPTPS